LRGLIEDLGNRELDLAWEA